MANHAAAVSKEYLSRIENWVGKAARYAPEYAQQATAILYMAQLGVDSQLVKSMGMALAKDLEEGGGKKPSTHKDIEIRAFRNQYGVRFVDMSGQYGELCIYRDSGGMPYVKGNRELVPMLMGRAELDVAFRRMVDGNYFNDK